MSKDNELNNTATELIKILSKYDLDSDKKKKINIIIKNVEKKEDKDKYINYLKTFIINKNNKDWTERDIYQYLNNKAHYDKAKDIFVNNLQYYMKLKDKTVTDISNDLYLSYSTVNDWYNGRAYPRVDKIEMLAHYLHLNTSDLTEERKKDKKGAVVPVLGNIPARYTY